MTTKEWLPFEKILENGIIIRKNSYIKLIRILPINYDLKSNLEKEAILNSYKIFLKTCDFNIQIIIQSKNEDLSKYFYNLSMISQKENTNKMKEIIENYIKFIKTKSEEKKASTKYFYIAIKYDLEKSSNDKQNNNEIKSIAINYLNESYFKIKESLSRCGNIIYDINSKDEVENILKSFFIIEKGNIKNIDWK